MAKTVGVSLYWAQWLEKIKASNIRKSKSEIVEEGLKKIKNDLDNEVEELLEARKLAKENKEWKEAEAFV